MLAQARGFDFGVWNHANSPGSDFKSTCGYKEASVTASLFLLLVQLKPRRASRIEAGAQVTYPSPRLFPRRVQTLLTATFVFLVPLGEHTHVANGLVFAESSYWLRKYSFKVWLIEKVVNCFAFLFQNGICRARRIWHEFFILWRIGCYINLITQQIKQMVLLSSMLSQPFCFYFKKIKACYIPSPTEMALRY